MSTRSPNRHKPLVILLLAFCLSAHPAGAQNLAQKYYMKGVEFQRKQIPSRALDYFEQALKEDSTLFEARYRRAKIFFDKKFFDRTLEDIAILRRQRPRAAEVPALAAATYQAMGQFDRALQAIDEALSLEDRPLYRLRKAHLLIQTARAHRAFAELDRVPDEAKWKQQVLELKAMAYQHLGKLNQSLRLYNQLIKSAPLPEYFYNRGVLLQRMDNYRGACLDFAKAARAGGKDALKALARCRWKQADFKGLEATCRAAVKLYPDEPFFYHLGGLALLRQGNHRDAIQWLERAHSLGLDSADLYNNLGTAYLATDRKQARRYFQKALQLDPGNAIARHNLDQL